MLSVFQLGWILERLRQLQTWMEQNMQFMLPHLDAGCQSQLFLVSLYFVKGSRDPKELWYNSSQIISGTSKLILKLKISLVQCENTKEVIPYNLDCK